MTTVAHIHCRSGLVFWGALATPRSVGETVLSTQTRKGRATLPQKYTVRPCRQCRMAHKCTVLALAPAPSSRPFGYSLEDTKATGHIIAHLPAGILLDVIEEGASEQDTTGELATAPPARARWHEVSAATGLVAADGSTRPTIFAEMSALAASTGAASLGQGFPDEDGPEWIREAAVTAIRGGANQYPPGRGIPHCGSPSPSTNGAGTVSSSTPRPRC